MAYDGEIYTTKPENVSKLVERLKSIGDKDYEWCDPYKCVIGHAKRLQIEETGEPDLGIGTIGVYDWLGMDRPAGHAIYMDCEIGGRFCKSRRKAIKFLSRMTGMPKKGFLERLFS